MFHTLQTFLKYVLQNGHTWRQETVYLKQINQNLTLIQIGFCIQDQDNNL